MNVTNLSQIEKNVSMLPRDEQLLLVERIIHRLRKKNIEEESDIESQLAVMASDPDIQKELMKINEEFASTELDGIPFEVRIPNKTTLKAMRDFEKGKNVKKFDTDEELFKDLEI